MADDVSIGRLVLDLPGMSAEQAARLAEQIGHGLMGRSGAFETLTVAIGDGPDEGPDGLAARILAALHQLIG